MSPGNKFNWNLLSAKSLVQLEWLIVSRPLSLIKLSYNEFCKTVPKDGESHWSDRYEVLCGGKVGWIAGDAEHKKQDLIIGGESGDKIPFYVCKGSFNNQIIPGKFYEPTGCCYVVTLNKEYCVKNYSLMTGNLKE